MVLSLCRSLIAPGDDFPVLLCILIFINTSYKNFETLRLYYINDLSDSNIFLLSVLKSSRAVIFIMCKRMQISTAPSLPLLQYYLSF